MLLTLCLSIFSSSLFAQDSVFVENNMPTKTWFSNAKQNKKLHYIGAYLSPELQYGSLAGAFTPISGMSAMLIFNKKWAVGMAGYGSAHNFTPTSISTAKALSFNANYGGLKLEYTPKPNDVVHVSFPLLIGAGMARIDSISARNGFRANKRGGRGRGVDFERRDFDRNEDAFFILQPGINVETNVLRVAKIFVGANYRIAAGKSTLTTTIPTFIPTSKQLSGLSLSFGAKIGIFAFDVQKKRHFPRFRSGRRGHQKDKQD